MNWNGSATAETRPPRAHLRTGGKGTWLLWALCGLMAAGLLAGGLLWHRRGGAPQASYFLAVLPFTVHDMALAPNGHTVAVVGFSESARTNLLWLYEVGGKEERRLAETEGASFPFWSPDGKAVGFFRGWKTQEVRNSRRPGAGDLRCTRRTRRNLE